MKPNVFISWSGEPSRYVAAALKDWLPMVIQSAVPWMSEYSIDKGTRSMSELSSALDEIRFGIVCLTPDNLQATWIHYEAGALSKQVAPESRLWTYLIRLKPKDVPPPLGQFQHTRAEKEDTRKLIHSINHAVNEEPLSDVLVNSVFDSLWPQFERILDATPKVQTSTKERSLEDMVAEILDLVRTGFARAQIESKELAYSTGIEVLKQALSSRAEVETQVKTPVGARPINNWIPGTLRKDGKSIIVPVLKLPPAGFYGEPGYQVMAQSATPPFGEGTYELEVDGNLQQVVFGAGRWFPTAAMKKPEVPPKS